MSDRPLLAIEDLRVDIQTPAGALHAVRGVDLSVGHGETLCLVGESGCGKSLTALALMDLLPSKARRTARRIQFAGADLLAVRARRMEDLRGNRLAMIFQEPMTSLNPSYTVGNQLEEALLRHRKASRGTARARAIELLEKVGITGAETRLRQYPHQLSGGLRQRAMIAMALMCGPDLIIADEPTTALDVTIQAQILHLLAELRRELKMGMILITHDLGVVARVADRVAVMYAGQIVEQGPVGAVFGRPLHPYTQGLMRCIPIPGRTRRGEKLGVIPGMVPTPIGDIAGCQFRNRCPYSHDECVRGEIAARDVADQHSYRCLLAPEIAARNGASASGAAA